MEENIFDDRRNPHAGITNNLYHRIKANARKIKKEFTLTKEDFFRLVTSPCFYCGQEPALKCYPTVKKGGRRGKHVINYSRPSLYNGLDRKDSSKGYTLENAVPSCKNCNLSKNVLKDIEFFKWILRVYDHLKLRDPEVRENLFKDSN